MITYKVLPNSGYQKSGLASSFVNEDSKLKINITQGALAQGAVQDVLLAGVSLELKTIANLDVSFCVLLAKKMADSSIDIVVVQSTSKSRGFPLLPTKGYENIVTLGEGVVKAGNTSADSVEYTEYVFA